MVESAEAPVWPRAAPHPRATAVLVIGVLSLAVMPLIGPVAWALGYATLREIDREPGRYSNRGTALAGMVCGIVSTILLIVAVALIVTIIVWATTGDGIKNYEERVAFLLADLVVVRW